VTTEELSRELVEIENALARLRAYRGEEFTDCEDGLWLNRRPRRWRRSAARSEARRW